MTDVAGSLTAALPRIRSWSAGRVAGVAALVAVCAAGAAMRFADFAGVFTTPFYDAAVRSMTLSWHNFFYGALDPSGWLSIDKPPLDLWLQVASTKALGFTSVALRLPPAIAGTLSVVLLYDLVRRGYGRWAGLAAGLALAVLPAAVLTSRSDTMDSVMAMLLVLAAWLMVRARPERRARAVVAAFAVAGLAFEVKLFEGTVALPALALLAWLALDAPWPRRLRTLALGGVAFLVVASVWAVVASLLPGPHPFPYGSNGTIWNDLLVYNGIGRFGNPPTAATTPGPLRLFDPSGPRHFGQLIGAELLCALAFGALAVLVRPRSGAAEPMDDAGRRRRAIGWGLGAWLVIGTLVASFMGRQWPRYLEAFTPAVAGVLGIAIVTIARATGRRALDVAALVACAVVAAVAGWPTGGHASGTIAAAAAAAAAVLLALPRPTRPTAAAVALAAALAVPFHTSVLLIRSGAGDSMPTGAMPAAKLERLSAYLRAHQGRARYEVAGATVFNTAALIVHDARPVLTLVSLSRPLLTPAELAQKIHAGEVRYALLRSKCHASSQGAGCTAVVRWARAHGTDVSRAAGLPQRGVLWRLRA